MKDALRIIVAKSPGAGSQAMQCMRAIDVNSPITQARYDRVVEIAFSDPQADFEPAERALIASYVGGSNGEELRTMDIRVRVNAREKEIVQEMAREAGQTVSDFIREAIGL